MQKFTLITILAITIIYPVSLKSQVNKSLPIFATYISDNDQERKAEALIKSIRLNAGTSKDAEILVFVDDRYSYTDKRLDLTGVKILQIEVKSELLTLPYTNKVYAAAQAEKIAEGKTNLLFWFDPETLVLDELQDLQLAKGKEIAIRPVFLTNKVAIKSDQQIDLFWTEIFKQANVDSSQIFVINTALEGTSIKSYFNCGVMSVNPSVKIFRKWADLLTKMLNKPDYLKLALVDVPHQIFFHQAVFTAAVLTSINKEHIQWLSLKCAYPLNLFNRMPTDKKINNLNQVNSLILEDVWNNNPKWLELIIVDPKVKEQLEIFFNNYNNVIDIK